MATGAYIGVSSAARSISKIYAGISGVAHTVKRAYIGVGGVARLWFASVPNPAYASTIYTYDQSSGYYHPIGKNEAYGNLPSYGVISVFTVDSLDNLYRQFNLEVVNSSDVTTTLSVIPLETIRGIATSVDYSSSANTANKYLFTGDHMTVDVKTPNADGVILYVDNNLVVTEVLSPTSQVLTASDVLTAPYDSGNAAYNDVVFYYGGNYRKGAGSILAASVLVAAYDNNVVNVYAASTITGSDAYYGYYNVIQFENTFICPTYYRNGFSNGIIVTKSLVSSGRIEDYMHPRCNRLGSLNGITISYNNAVTDTNATIITEAGVVTNITCGGSYYRNNVFPYEDHFITFSCNTGGNQYSSVITKDGVWISDNALYNAPGIYGTSTLFNGAIYAFQNVGTTGYRIDKFSL